MKNTIKILIHTKLAKWKISLLGYMALQACQRKFKPLVIRKNTSDIRVFRCIFVNKELHLPVKIEPKVIVDGGAYTGLSCLFFYDTYPTAKIFAIEPEKSNFETLRLNIQSYKNIIPINAGLWSKKTSLKIVDNEIGKWGFSLLEVEDENSCDIKAITLSDVLEENQIETIDILKLDIEGAEKELFSFNYESWLEKVNILIIELHDRYIEGCSKAVYQAMNNKDWKEFKKGEKVIFIRKSLL